MHLSIIYHIKFLYRAEQEPKWIPLINGIEELLQDINVSSFKTDPIGTVPVQVPLDSFRQRCR